jgi:glutamine amidotransferase
MQMMVQRSEEGIGEGLGWISGECRRLQCEEDRLSLRLPHMGWNEIVVRADEPLFKGFGNDTAFYFLHSFHVVPRDRSSAIAHADYGGRFVCAIRKDNLTGVQFHPEKSHDWGERLLLNFASS